MKDSKLRSIVKGLTWRMLASLDTIVIAYFVTGAIGKALTIGATEVLSKLLLFYIHERVWNRYAGNKMYQNSWSLVKAFTWRFTGTIDTIVLSFLIITFGTDTPNNDSPLAQASTIGMIELVTKMLLYFVHERIWKHVRFGRVQAS